jgi:hypothetical protein
MDTPLTQSLHSGPQVPVSRRRVTLGLLSGLGVAIAGGAGLSRCMAQGSGPAGGLPLLGANAAGPRERRESYYVDIRRLIGGDGEVSVALSAARRAGLGAWIAGGTYTHSGALDIGGMRIEAASDARISARGPGTAMFSAAGSLARLPNLAADPRQGSSTVAFRSAPGLTAGDWIVLFDPVDGSWHESRPYYRAGEWCQVREVMGAVAQLAAPLAASYRATRMQAFHPVLASADLIGGRWDSAGKHLAHLSLCAAAVVDIEQLAARANTAVMLDRCVDSRVHIGEGLNAGVGGDDYLVCLSNSYRARVRGGQLYARRHPVAIGGGDVPCGVPNRDCLVEGANLRNDPATDLPCADIHGNSELCGYKSCQIYGGVSLGGASPIYQNCTITARADGNLAELTEFKGGRVDLTGSVLFSPAVHVRGGRGLIDLGSQNNSLNRATTRDVEFELIGFRLSAPNLAADETVLRISNQGSVSRLIIVIEDGEFELGAPVRLIRTGARVGTTPSGSFVVENVRGLPQGSRLHYSEDDVLKNIPVRTDLPFR